jgi:hypothetical protein
MAAANDTAMDKRQEIKQIGKEVFLVVAIAAAAFGMIVVGAIYLVKQIIFNAKVLEAKDETVAVYEANAEAIKELNEKVLGLSVNEALETVAKERDPSCMTLGGELKDFADDIAMARKCSALRVIPDAIPWTANASALGASLGELLRYPGVVKEADNIGNAASNVAASGTGAIEAAFSIRGSSENVLGLLRQTESSIRPFAVNTANFEWRANGEIALSVTSSSFFVQESNAEKKTKVVKVAEEKKKR